MTGQTRLLARTFFGRMFESDLMPSGLPQIQLVISVIAFLAAPAALVPILLAKKYARAGNTALRGAAMTQDRALALLVAMLATAMITLVIWENIFPDRRDSRHLGVLPVGTRSFVIARLAAVMAVFTLVFAATTVIGAGSFGLVQATFGAPGGVVRTVVAQFAMLVGMEAFVFFGIIAVQCLVLSMAGAILAQRLALAMQVLVVVLIVQMPMALPGRHAFLAIGPGGPAWALQPFAWAVPPIWFLSLYEVIATGGHAATRSLALVAAFAGIGVPGLAVLLYAASYRRLTRLAIEGTPTAPTQPRAAGMMTVWLAALPVSSAGRGVCSFALRTLIRSRQHRMLMSVWLGLAVAFVLSAVLPLVLSSKPMELATPRVEVLVVPLIISALTLTGMRMLFALPTDIKANWVFRLHEPVVPGHAIDGAFAALVTAGVLPGVVVAFTSAGILWGIPTGVRHALFTGLLGLLLAVVFMRGMDKVPFTCTYAPGKARVTKFWAAYLAAFSMYTYSMAAAEAALLSMPRAYVVVSAIFIGLLIVLWMLHRSELSRLPQLRFEEEPLDTPVTVSLVR